MTKKKDLAPWKAKFQSKPGPQLIEIDPKLVEALASVGCPNTEIADILGVSVSTLSKRNNDDLVKGRSDLRMKLRRKQVDMALQGDRTMLIWLGKQYLGQTEKQEVTQAMTLRTFGPEAIERARTALQAIEAQEKADAAV